MERKTEKTEKSVQEEIERFKDMFLKAMDNTSNLRVRGNIPKGGKIFIICLKDLEIIVKEIKKIIKENAELRSKCAEYEDMRFHIARLEEDIEQ